MPARTARSIGRISLGLFLSAQFEKEADGQQHIHDTQKRTEVMSLLDQIIESCTASDPPPLTSVLRQCILLSSQLKVPVLRT